VSKSSPAPMVFQIKPLPIQNQPHILWDFRSPKCYAHSRTSFAMNRGFFAYTRISLIRLRISINIVSTSHPSMSLSEPTPHGQQTHGPLFNRLLNINKCAK
jgi:hypothetical protein